MKRGYVDTPGGLIHYRTEGKGDPILLLHAVGSSSDQFTEMLPILGKAHQAIAIDILGYGNSDLPPQEYKIEDYARNALNFLDVLGIEKINLVGFALGSSIAVEIAASYPKRVDKLILHGCLYPDPKTMNGLQEFSNKNRMQLKEDGSHLMTLWQNKHRNSNLVMCQRAVVNYLSSGLGLRAEDGHTALFTYDIGAKLPMIKSPTLLLRSAPERDAILHVETARTLISKFWTKTIEGTSYFPTWEKPEEIAKTILEFVNDSRI
jgi:pimeloyl-ACP methyl ester carboxylesterase